MATMSLLTSLDVYVVRVTLAIIIGTLMAIVYCLRYLVLMERRLERIERHTEHVVHRIFKEERKIENNLRFKKSRK